MSISRRACNCTHINFFATVLYVEVVGSSPIKFPVVSLSKKLYHYCLVLAGSSWNGFERDFTIELKIN